MAVDRDGGFGGLAGLRAHLIGIAGAGMRSLARVLHQRGCLLSGSDLAPAGAGSLASLGIPVYQGHRASHVTPDVQLVVHSDAIEPDNPERAEALRLGIPAASYFDVVGWMTRGTRAVAVAGTHGKSTTTAMTARILIDAGLDPTVLCGAAPVGQSDGGRSGSGRVVLVEACEYRANFLKLHPTHAVVLNVEPDHFDCYQTTESLEDAFARFVALLPPSGLLLAGSGCPTARRLAAIAPCRVETFGMAGSPGATAGLPSSAEDAVGRANRGAPRVDCAEPWEPPTWSARLLGHRLGRYRFVLLREGQELCAIALRMPGVHNVLNAMAAAALASAEGVSAAQIARSLGAFAGVHRRQEIVGVRSGVVLVDDYAHHPTEVRATLQAVRQMCTSRRILCVFQPHQASRTGRLLDELAASLQNVDWLWVADIFRAREPFPAPGEVTAADLAERARRLGARVADTHALDEIGRQLDESLGPGDVLVAMGAGDVRRICDGFHNGLRGVRAAG